MTKFSFFGRTVPFNLVKDSWRLDREILQLRGIYPEQQQQDGFSHGVRILGGGGGGGDYDSAETDRLMKL